MFRFIVRCLVLVTSACATSHLREAISLTRDLRSNSSLPTLDELIRSETDLTIFATAFTSANLVGKLNTTLNYTIFAPNDDAFVAIDPPFLAKLLTPSWNKHLQNLVTFHVTLPTADGNRLLSTDITDGQVFEMLNSEQITAVVRNRGITLASPLTNGSDIVAVDILSSNGVLYKIDTVFSPAAFEDDVFDLGDRFAEFTILQELMDIFGLTGTKGEFTILAPTNEAFLAQGNESLAALKEDTEALGRVLGNHIIVGVFPSTSLEDGIIIKTIGGLDVTVTISEAVARQTARSIMFNDANVIIADILAVNGIVYGIDMVLMEPETSNGVPISAPQPIPPNPVPLSVPIPVSLPLPALVPVLVPVPVPKSSPVPLPVPKPLPVEVPKPVTVPVPVPKPISVPLPVPKPVTVPLSVPKPVTEPVRGPLPLPKPVPVPLPVPPLSTPIVAITDAPSVLPSEAPSKDGLCARCDDNDACTTDTCDPIVGCVHTTLNCGTNKACDKITGTCVAIDKLRPCIAVIDESDNFFDAQIDAKWAAFRANFPNRFFCLLQPLEPSYSRIYFPTRPDFLSDPRVKFAQVNRDEGNRTLASNWLSACGYDDFSATGIDFIGLFVDESGSMTRETVQASLDKLDVDLAAANLTYCSVFDDSEDWITPFDTTLGTVGGGGSCN
jgi:uncharacterized surface protein with fasciclin (FAS1) repeats